MKMKQEEVYCVSAMIVLFQDMSCHNIMSYDIMSSNS